MGAAVLGLRPVFCPVGLSRISRREIFRIFHRLGKITNMPHVRYLRRSGKPPCATPFAPAGTIRMLQAGRAVVRLLAMSGWRVPLHVSGRSGLLFLRRWQPAITIGQGCPGADSVFTFPACCRNSRIPCRVCRSRLLGIRRRFSIAPGPVSRPPVSASFRGRLLPSRLLAAGKKCAHFRISFEPETGEYLRCQKRNTPTPKRQGKSVIALSARHS